MLILPWPVLEETPILEETKMAGDDDWNDNENNGQIYGVNTSLEVNIIFVSKLIFTILIKTTNIVKSRKKKLFQIFILGWMYFLGLKWIVQLKNFVKI